MHNKKSRARGARRRIVLPMAGMLDVQLGGISIKFPEYKNFFLTIWTRPGHPHLDSLSRGMGEPHRKGADHRKALRLLEARDLLTARPYTAQELAQALGVNKRTALRYLLEDFPLEILSWVQGWGPRVEVLAPENLRRRWLEEARQVLEEYAG